MNEWIEERIRESRLVGAINLKIVYGLSITSNIYQMEPEFARKTGLFCWKILGKLGREVS